MEQNEYRQGIMLALSAYVLWGLTPLFFKMLHQVPPVEILLHRIIWSFVFMLLLMTGLKGFHRIKLIIKRPKQLAILMITSLLIACNWLLYIWAVNNDHMLDASLGYFINPLLNVMLGMIFLDERLTRLQWLAMILAAIGVLVQVVSFGSVPIVSIALAVTFGLYALLRKKVNIDAQSGLLLETALLFPVAVGYLLLSPQAASAGMLTNSWDVNLLLLLAGVVTSIPLLCFSGAAIRIPLTVLGVFQYIGPSIMFLLAVALYNESFDLEKGLTFGFIWLALVVFTLDMVYRRRQSLKVTSILKQPGSEVESVTK